MQTIHIQGDTGDSQILIGEKLANVTHYTPTQHPVIITDKRVWDLYGDRFPGDRVIIIGQGEKIKTLATVKMIYRRLVDFKADRSTFIVGIGGGIVCDITGFAASTYMRGLGFGYVATTLLSQVDASVGGKNGVNLDGYKNMVGVFNQPDFVICDLALLRTLSEREISCGMAEMIKHAAIADADLFSYLENNHQKVLALDSSAIQKLVYDSVRIKAAIVRADEKEKGERRKLNFGHTFGHALEKSYGLSHGEAVGIGMVMASELSATRGYLAETEIKRLKKLLANMNLPVRIPLNPNPVWDALQKDKKRADDHINFVMLAEIGKALVKTVALQDVKQSIGSLFKT
jgi:3-dehydroquinate synthase